MFHFFNPFAFLNYRSIDGNRKGSIAYAINTPFFLDFTDISTEGTFETDYPKQPMDNGNWVRWEWAERFVKFLKEY